MKAVHAKRLLKLAAFLRTVPVDKFSYGSWVGSGWDHWLLFSPHSDECVWSEEKSDFEFKKAEGPDYEATPKQVAAHITKFVKKNWARYADWKAAQ